MERRASTIQEIELALKTHLPFSYKNGGLPRL